MISRYLLSVLTVMVLSGCGGAQSDTTFMEEDLTAEPSGGGAAVSGSDSKPATDTKAEPDETAQKAREFCEKEVAKSAQTPPEMLDKKQISACLIAVRPVIQTECSKGVQRQVILKVIVGKDGSVVGVFPVGDGADSAEAACAAEKVKPVKFPMFTAKEQFTIEKFPFDIAP